MRKGCQWVKEWNLMIPAETLNNAWGGFGYRLSRK